MAVKPLRPVLTRRRIGASLQKTSAVKALEDHAKATTGRTMFADKNRPDPGSWVTSLHSHLSNFIHARNNSSNARIWRSNGPVYSAGHEDRVGAWIDQGL